MAARERWLTDGARVDVDGRDLRGASFGGVAAGNNGLANIVRLLGRHHQLLFVRFT
jgi:hypothetical protein